MNRRNFINSSCAVCVGAIGLGFLATELSGCASIPILKLAPADGLMNIPLSSFKDGQLLVVRNSHLEFDILLVKKSESEITPLLMKCSHQDNPLTANKSGLYCPTQGSTFDLNGNVTKEPALTSLKKFKTEISNQIVTINVKS